MMCKSGGTLKKWSLGGLQRVGISERGKSKEENTKTARRNPNKEEGM